MNDQPGSPPPAPDLPPQAVGADKTMRTIGIVLLAGVVLCGVCGSCLLGLTLVLPLLQ